MDYFDNRVRRRGIAADGVLLDLHFSHTEQNEKSDYGLRVGGRFGWVVCLSMPRRIQIVQTLLCSLGMQKHSFAQNLLEIILRYEGLFLTFVKIGPFRIHLRLKEFDLMS